jgi:transposase-like protein
MREEYPMTEQKESGGELRNFSPEFKSDAVRLCQSGGESRVAMAKRLDVAKSSVRGWKRQSDLDAGDSGSDAFTTSERKESVQLRTDNTRITMERDFLKSKRRHGSPRVRERPVRDGVCVSRKTIAASMKKSDLVGRKKDRFR